MKNLTLSITTIGDLLLRQTITITDNGEPIKGVKLCVPIYQRPYKWTARNAIQLLDDIIDAKNSNKERYRVGTLILHKAKGKNLYDIVDGQQRIGALRAFIDGEFALKKKYLLESRKRAKKEKDNESYKTKCDTRNCVRI